jgi:hypothetical protein
MFAPIVRTGADGDNLLDGKFYAPGGSTKGSVSFVGLVNGEVVVAGNNVKIRGE